MGSLEPNFLDRVMGHVAGGGVMRRLRVAAGANGVLPRRMLAPGPSSCPG